MNNIAYTVLSMRGFSETVDTVTRETEAVGFRVLHIHDVQETLSKKGFTIEPLKIIEVCNAKNAYNAIKINIDLSLMLPCKINVYIKDNVVYIAALHPTFMNDIFPELDLDEVINEVDQRLMAIVDKAK